MEALKAQLRTLKLSSMVEGLELRNKHALENQISYLEFLELLVEDECVRRQSNGYQTRLRESKLQSQKILDSYDFSFQPDLDKKMVHELASGRFIDLRQNVVFMGKPGVGKTHLAHAIGLEAMRYETSSVMITTNRNFEDWGTLFGDMVMASAIIDRIVHHAVIIKVTGTSYRIKNFIEIQSLFNETTPMPKKGRPRKNQENESDEKKKNNSEND